MSKAVRVFSREMKLAALRRMLAGENVSTLARELKLRRKLLYAWRDNFRAGGPEALRTRGRPRKSAPVALPEASPVTAPALDELAKAKQRVAELERKIGQQQVELDFFRQALRQVRGKRRPSDGPGATASTPSCKR
ncbi:MAG: transposase [Dongiaceae bacterium]